jgi:hypothetical protein
MEHSLMLNIFSFRSYIDNILTEATKAELDLQKENNYKFINQIMSEIEFDGKYTIEGSTTLILRIQTKEPNVRFLVKQQFEKWLASHSYQLDPNNDLKNTSLIIKPDGSTLKLVFKDETGGVSGGSKLAGDSESAQCLYAAVLLGGFALDKPEDFLDHYKSILSNCDIPSKALDTVLKTIVPNPDWAQSCIKVAHGINNFLVTKRKASDKLAKYTFHRGSTVVKKINAFFEKAKTEYNLLAKNDDDAPICPNDVNKWNPADIWLLTPQAISKINAFNPASLADLNDFILQLYNDNEGFGISLKKLSKNSTVSLQVNNHPSDPDSYNVDAAFKEFMCTSDSNNGYIVADLHGEQILIQFRVFEGFSWRCEIKGKAASHGKAGFGVINQLLKRVSKITLSPENEVKTILKTGKGKEIIESRYNQLVNSTFIRSKDKGLKLSSLDNYDIRWQFSKYMVLELFTILMSLTPQQRNRFTHDIVAYAKSQTEFSSVYIKFE